MGRDKRKTGGLVYSTTHGKMCPRCEQPIDNCQCPHATTPVGDGMVRVSLETKGRKGKGVTLVTGLPLIASELNALGKQLKKRCGTGGTVKNGVIEIQGDHRDVLLTELQKLGYDAKRSGG
jgi:translation initiation factor 1